MAFLGLQSSFTAGELSPSLSARVDLSKYQTGCSELENMVVHPHGGASKRNGFRYLGELPSRTRLMPFVFAADEVYMLAWSDGSLRIFTRDGVLLLEDGSEYVIVTPFSADVVFSMSFVQSGDVIYLVSEEFPPYKIMRYNHTKWVLEEVNFEPKVPCPTGLGGILHDVRTDGERAGDGVGRRLWKYMITQVDAKGEESLGSVSCSVDCPENLRNTCYPKLSWSVSSGATEYRVYQEKNGKYGYIGSSVGTSFDAKNIAPDMTDSPPMASNPFVNGNYPHTVCFFQQRLVFGGSKKKPQTLWFSRSGNYENFCKSSPLKFDDAMEVSIAGNEVSRIEWLVPLRTLLVGTGGTEWEVKSQGGVLTGSDISAVPQSYRGSSPLPALVVGNSVLHMSRTNREMRDLLYDFGTDSYAGSDHAVLASHLFERNSLVDWAYQQSPDSVIWCVRDDGVLLGHTYLREHEVFGWHRHYTDGVFESICTLPGRNTDELFAVIRRKVENLDGIRDVYYLERMENRYDVQSTGAAAVTVSTAASITDNGINATDTTIMANSVGMHKLGGVSTVSGMLTSSGLDGGMESIFFVDSALSYMGEPTKHVMGLDHLFGKKVAIVADGAVCPHQQVRRLYSDIGEELGIGVKLLFPASSIVVGLPYRARLRSMGIEPGNTEEGTALGRKKSVNRIGVYFRETSYARIGTDFTHMDEVKWRESEAPGMPIKPHTEDAWIFTHGGYNNQVYVCVESDVPLACSVLAIFPEISISGI